MQAKKQPASGFFAAGDLDSGELSRISLLTETFDGGVGVVNSYDPNAASKIKMLFDVRRNLRLANDIVIEIPQNNTPEWFEVMNYLRRAQTSGTRIPVMKLIVADGKSQQDNGKLQTYLEITLEDTLVTSNRLVGTANAPIETVSVNYAAVKFQYIVSDNKNKE